MKTVSPFSEQRVQEKTGTRSDEDEEAMSPKAIRAVVPVFCITVLALLTFGFVMLTSTSSSAYRGDSFYFAKRQALWLAIGVVACVVTARMDYRLHRKAAWPLFVGAVVLLVGVLILGTPINGARRWYVFGPVRFQPSEFSKYALLIVLVAWLEKMQMIPRKQSRPRIQNGGWGVFAPLAIAGGPGLLILVEPDLGTALLLGAVALVLMWLAGASSRWLGVLAGATGAGVSAFLVAIFKYGMFREQYQVRRILHWWYETDPYGINYQQYMAELAFGSGGIWGLGLGNSRQKMAYLPEAHTDFIFPIIGEELGLVATLAVVVAFCILFLCGIVLAMRAPDQFGRLLGAGIITVIALQALINMAVVTDTIPNKGMPLPFISYGGSNLVMTLAAVGVLLNIAWKTQSQTAMMPGKPEEPPTTTG